MLKRLQEKWKVSGTALALIITTFAVGGSLTGWAGRKILGLAGIGSGTVWILLYILLITLLWPLAVLLVSIPLGQFSFFNRYIHKIGQRIGLAKKPENSEKKAENGRKTPKKPQKIAIFASGAGSNAQKIIDHFRKNPRVKVMMILTNNPQAGVLKIARDENIPALVIDKERFFKKDGYWPVLAENGVNFIVLAGFLWKIPSFLLNAYPHKIVNIHPALLPKFGGKGMYGHHVHEAVLAAGETESGITIHWVDEQYDHGQIIRQVHCPVLQSDTADSLAARIHGLEHAHFPLVIEEILAAGG